MAATQIVLQPASQAGSSRELDTISRQLVADLHTPSPRIFWTDLALSATVGWLAFVCAVIVPSGSPWLWVAAVVSALALYRGLCFTHEITHLRRHALRGFETTWNVLFGVPLMLPSFTYVGVHQSHHSLSTYGTKDDPEYLPFASSRRLIWVFALQSSLILPMLLILRFVVLSPIGLIWPAFHRFLEKHASSFSMNPEYRRDVTAPMATRMRRWELVMLLAASGLILSLVRGWLPMRVLLVWFVVVAIVSFVNTLRVLGAHEYETDGSPRDRYEQVLDSIDTPGGPWSELWAPVGLRYHALHHYFPGIPYHNLGAAYRRIVDAAAVADQYRQSTNPSLRHSLTQLYRKARAATHRRP